MNTQIAGSSRRQAGGTLLGLIVGLIIGLGIAVAVALTIKNTSLPFTTKGARSEKPADLPPTQLADPNKPLYTNGASAKQGAKEAASAQGDTKAQDAQASEAAPPNGAIPPNTVTAGTSPAPVVEKSAAQKAISDAAPAVAKGDAGEEKFTYYLQAGAFMDRSDAENAKARLALQGVSATISEKTSGTGKLYRVRIGPFAQAEAVNRVRTKLSEGGVDVAIVKVPK